MNEEVSLRDYVERRFEDQDKAVNAALTAADRAVSAALAAAKEAVTKAEAASEKRFDSVNEFRSTLADQQRTLMPRSEVELMIKNMNDKIEIISKSNTLRSGEIRGTKEGWGLVIGVGGILVAIIAILSKFFIK